MFKRDLIEEILQGIKKIDCYIIKVYGVSWGVGYDLNVLLTLNNNKTHHLDAHALPKSWACIGHLRDNQTVFYNYTGRNDVYRDYVINYWTSKQGLEEYLQRFKKCDLIQFMEALK